jgi:acylphosphatase
VVAALATDPDVIRYTGRWLAPVEHHEGVIARHVRVHGYVQGVSFRAACRWEAQARGVTGWARNELDGTVSAWFEGEPEAVEAMVEWCRRGPRAARVTDIEVKVVAPEERRRFEVG